MFEFFDQILGFIETLWNFVLSFVEALFLAISALISSLSLPLAAINYLPGILAASVALFISVYVVKFLIGR